jgi:hypothetical protein
MPRDWRDIRAGFEIPRENYCDQPYVVVMKDGNWLCVLTTGPSTESAAGQHVVSTISTDKGKTWSDLNDIESTTSPMSSWVTAVAVPSGRVYAIYDFRGEERGSQHGGWLVFRYTDDFGHTWSAERYRIPFRLTRADRENISGGRHQYFWCIDKPVVAKGKVFFGLPKVHNGFVLDADEGWVICSDNILSESDPAKIHWETLPDGEDGVYNPDHGPIQEEQNIEVLSDGTLYMANRTSMGHPAYAVSRDGGHTWSKPQFMRYANGKLMKTPRACPRLWKASNGKFLFWFHNDSYPGWGNASNRNPVWVSGGIEADGDIKWSQPEILLYDDDYTMLGMSYPDFIEQDGRYWASETQKTVARVHEINAAFLDGLWNQPVARTAARQGIVYESSAPLSAGGSFALPALPSLENGGFSIDFWLKLDDVAPGQVLLSSFGKRVRGFRITTAANNALKLDLHDGQVRRWIDVLDSTNPGANARSIRQWDWTSDDWVLQAGRLHHVVVIVDGLSDIVSIVVDGVLCDGGESRIQGWWRLLPRMFELNDEGICTVGANVAGQITHLRIYDRYLGTSEAVGNYRAGCPEA